MNRYWAIAIAICIAMGTSHLWIWADTVELTSGQTLHGEVRLESSGILLQPADKSAAPTTMPLDQIRSVSLRDEPQVSLDDTGMGALKTEYFLGYDFDPAQRKIVRSDSILSGRWDELNPFAQGKRPWVQFCVRWTGQIRPRFSEVYKFDVQPQDMTRLWIDHQLIVDPRAEMWQRIPLQAGRKYDIRVDQIARPRPFILQWESTSEPRSVVPSNCLFVKMDEPEAPAVTRIISPADGTVLMGKSDLPISVGIDAGSHRFGKVQIYDNNELLRTLDQSPYQFTWSAVPFGDHTLLARAFDESGTSWPTLPVHFTAGDDDAGKLSRPWGHSLIGSNDANTQTSSVELKDRTGAMRMTGGELYAGEDKCQFLFQALKGDGEIVAHLTDVQPADPKAPTHPAAGLMIRSSLAPQSVSGSILYSPAVGSVFVSRKLAGAGSTSANVSLKAPGFLRMTREGSHLAGYRSTDGEHWEFIGDAETEFPETVLAGLVLSSQGDNIPATTNFDAVSVIRDETMPIAKTSGSAIQLTDGTIIYGWFRFSDRGRNGPEVTFELELQGRPKIQASFPASLLARVLYHPLTPQTARLASSEQTGIILTNADFCAGPVTEMGTDWAAVINEIFGRREFHSRDTLSTALLRPVMRSTAMYEVSLTNGSSFPARSLSIGNGELIVDTISLGRLRFPAASVAEWRLRAK